MNKYRRKSLSIFLLFAVLFASVITCVAVRSDNYMKIDEYRGAEEYTAPTKEGFVFAGWYKDAAFTEPLEYDVTEGYAYAKFINPLAFTIKNQFNKEADKESEQVDLRIVTTIDSENYSAVEFYLEKDGIPAKYPLTVQTVYTTLAGNQNGSMPYTPREQFENEDSTYFAVEKLTGIPSSAFGSKLIITPKYYTLDGTTVTGTAREIILQERLPEPETVFDIDTTPRDDKTNIYMIASRPNDIAIGNLIVGGNWVEGGIYIDGWKETGLHIAKHSATGYYVYFSMMQIVPTEGMLVTIQGTYVDTTGEVIRVAPITFEYKNNAWCVVSRKLVRQVAFQGVTEGKGNRENLFITMDVDDNIPASDLPLTEWISGGVYMDDQNISDKVSLYKQGIASFYLDFENSQLQPCAGTQITIKGIVTDGTDHTHFAAKNYSFAYNGQQWYMVEHVEVTMTDMGTYPFFTVSPADSLPNAQGANDWSWAYWPRYGGTYYKRAGETEWTYSEMSIVKLTNNKYLLNNTLASSLTDGMQIKMGGIFQNGTYADTGVMFDDIILEWDAENKQWIKEPTKLVENGASEYVIVRGANATSSEVTASTELQSYIKEITGATIPIVTDNAEKKNKEIIVGKTNREVTGQFNREELGEEGYIIQSGDDKLWIVGGEKRGTLYGVYAFLEDYLGCRFYTEEVEKVPEMQNIILEQIEEDKWIPTFEYRDLAWADMDSEDISAKRNLNTYLWGRTLSGKVGGGISHATGTAGHTFFSLVSPSEYFATHPEYFSMDASGNRVSDKQLCLTNSEVLTIAIAKVREWIREYPDAQIIVVSQNDTDGPCLCNACKAIYNAEGGAYSGAIIRFANAIAENIAEDYPNISILTHAYQYSRSAPKTVAADNVIVSLSAIESCFSHGHTADCGSKCATYLDGSSNTFIEDLDAWSKICVRLYAYDYSCNVWHTAMTISNFEVLRTNMKLFADYGVKGVTVEGNFRSEGGELGELRAYLLAKLLKNPNMDEAEYQAHINDFLEGVYGPGGTYIRDYITLADNLTKETCFNLSPSPEEQYPNTQKELNAGKLPEDLTVDMVRNYTDTDWTKYWNWYSDVEANRIISEGEELFAKAMQEAQTTSQKKQLEKIYTQVRYIKSYYYKQKIDIGYENFSDLINNYINQNSSSFTNDEKTKLPTTIRNYALSQLYAEYIEYNKELVQTFVDYGFDEYRLSANLRDRENYNYANAPYNWPFWTETTDLTTSGSGSALTLSSSDSLAYNSNGSCAYWAYSGGIYINGEKTDIPLVKTAKNKYTIGVTASEHTVVTIDGVFGDGKNIVKFDKATFIYVYKESMLSFLSTWKWIKTTNVTIYDSAVSDSALYFEVSDNDSLGYNANNSKIYQPLAGGVYVDDVLYSNIGITKYESNKYRIIWTSYNVTPIQGMKVTIDGIFGTADGAVELEATFRFNGSEWILCLDTGVTGQSGSTIWLKTDVSDTLAHNTNWSCRYWLKDGSVKIDGNDTSIALIKVYADTYLIVLDNHGYEVTDGMVITIDGVFGNDDSSFWYGPITLRFDASIGTSGAWVQSVVDEEPPKKVTTEDAQPEEETGFDWGDIDWS